RPRRPHDGNEVPRLDRQVHAVERPHLLVAHYVDLGEGLGLDERVFGIGYWVLGTPNWTPVSRLGSALPIDRDTRCLLCVQVDFPIPNTQHPIPTAGW